MKAFYQLFYKDLFLNTRLFIWLGIVVTLFLLSFFFPFLSALPFFLLFVIITVTCLDIATLYLKKGIIANRNLPERLSNGDDNPITIFIESLYSFSVYVKVIDEIPHQFQRRDIFYKSALLTREKKRIVYQLKPVKRGEYDFGNLHIYVSGFIGFVSRRYTFNQQKIIPVYPSYLQMRRYELMAISNRLSDYGIKKIRRIGHSMEFEQIKNYVPGDDFRTINWKATARKGDLMVNNFTDEKSQHVYSIIDKSRVMKMPFNGLSLLDYAINASLVLSNVALLKEDKAGLITISEKLGAFVPADKRPAHINKILEVLYREKTRYLETDFEALYIAIRRQIKQRSLLVLFTNFESLGALERQIPYLKKLARLHLLLIVFFENTELKQLVNTSAKDLEGIYIQTIAEKMTFEKKLIAKELNKLGIQTILTTPENLTINTINRYLQIKARQAL